MTPCCPSPAKASPESLSRTRDQFLDGFVTLVSIGWLGLTDFEASVPLDLSLTCDQLGDSLLVVANVGLVQKDVSLEEVGKTAFDDLLNNLCRLGCVLWIVHGSSTNDFSLGLDDFRWDFGALQVLGASGGDVHRHFSGQALDVVTLVGQF